MQTQVIQSLKIFSVIFVLFFSCSTPKHKKEETGFHSDRIQTQYCLEVMTEKKDNETLVKIHSHISGSVYMIEVSKIQEVLDYETNKIKAKD